MDVSKIPTGNNPPWDINVIVEIPLGGVPVKYELDKASGAMFVNRFLHTAMYYPGNYGFIPGTLADDGDPCDVVIVVPTAVVPGAVVRCRPIGALMMRDEAGGDEKIIAVPTAKLTRRYENVHEYTDLPEITRQQIEHFFEHYKDLEPGKWVKVVGWGNAAEAEQMILDAIERAKNAKG
jgi:inorganic pyrophosphatase